MFSIFNYMCQMLCISEINILAYNEIRFYTYIAEFFFFLNGWGNSAGSKAHTVVNKQICMKKYHQRRKC